jgi:hypothetical protein
MSILHKIDKFESRMDQLIKSIVDKLPTEKIEESKPVEKPVVETITTHRNKNEQDDYDRLLIQMNERWKKLDEEKRKSKEIRSHNQFEINREDFNSDWHYEFARMSDGW